MAEKNLSKPSPEKPQKPPKAARKSATGISRRLSNLIHEEFEARFLKVGLSTLVEIYKVSLALDGLKTILSDDPIQIAVRDLIDLPVARLKEAVKAFPDLYAATDKVKNLLELQEQEKGRAA